MHIHFLTAPSSSPYSPKYQDPPPKGEPQEEGTFSGVAEKMVRMQRALAGPSSGLHTVVSTLAGAVREELNLLLEGLDWAHLLRKDSQQPSKGAVLELISKQRVDDVSVNHRGGLLRALQERHSCPTQQGAIAKLLLATRGSELEQLKEGLDLHRLVYSGLKKLPELQKQVLAHLSDQAQAKGRVQLLSDIDDTFVCKLGDQRYPKGTVYPGVRQFYQEMNRGEGQVFISARPEDVAGGIRAMTRKSLHQHGLSEPKVILGSWSSLRSHHTMAQGKVAKIQEMGSLYPERELVYLGDSGQGDAISGRMLKEMSWPNYRCTLIHDIKQHSPQQRQQHQEREVHFFDTYVGAALLAQEQGLLDQAAVTRVARAAVAEFSQLKLNPQQSQERRAELKRDLAQMNAQLPPDQAVRLP